MGFINTDVYILVSDPFTVSVNGENIVDEDRREFQCRNIAIPAQQVLEGDAIGVCTRRFPQQSVGGLVLTSASGRAILRDEADDFEELYPGVTIISDFVSRADLDTSNRRLHIFGNITGEVCSTC